MQLSALLRAGAYLAPGAAVGDGGPCCAAGQVEVEQVRICYGGVAPKCIMATNAQAALEGQPWSQATLDAALLAVAKDVNITHDAPGWAAVAATTASAAAAAVPGAAVAAIAQCVLCCAGWAVLCWLGCAVLCCDFGVIHWARGDSPIHLGVPLTHPHAEYTANCFGYACMSGRWSVNKHCSAQPNRAATWLFVLTSPAAELLGVYRAEIISPACQHQTLCLWP